MATKKPSKPNFLTAMFEKSKSDKEGKGKEGSKKEEAMDKRQMKKAPAPVKKSVAKKK